MKHGNVSGVSPVITLGGEQLGATILLVRYMILGMFLIFPPCKVMGLHTGLSVLASG